MATTKLENIKEIDPQVLGAFLDVKLVDAIKLSPLVDIDNTLVGRPGSKLTLPKFQYIGDADGKIGEGEAMVPVALNADTEEVEIQKASEVVTEELKKIFDKHVKDREDILVVGLGNAYVTPDSLGPKVIKDIDITRHFLKYAPEYIDPNTRPVTAISPGVLGTTGIETSEIVKGIVDNVKPKLVIVIDSLASKSIERISSTIQIADTGIVPGAGVGNTRKELSQNTLNIPVIAIGIPTVVDAVTIVSDTINYMYKHFSYTKENINNPSKVKPILFLISLFLGLKINFRFLNI